MGYLSFFCILFCLFNGAHLQDDNTESEDNEYVNSLLHDLNINASLSGETTSTWAPMVASTTVKAVLQLPPAQAEQESSMSMAIFFVLLVLTICVLVVHLLLKTDFHYLPESVAVIFVGLFVGIIVKILAHTGIANWQAEEHFPPTMFFLILLPPIIFESGYNLHKGNFFQNIGTILLFAIFGTIISALVVGGSVYLLGVAGVVFRFNLVESFTFGSLISAVDPVATLAIFNAMDVDPILYMLVFGESILNDAVAIVLAKTATDMAKPAMAEMSGVAIFFVAVGNFCLMFFASAAIGVAFGLFSALVLKLIDLRKTPSLELALMLVFAYAPYGLAEGMHLSGIMAILFTGIVMSHYTHFNLSPVTQITVQQIWRTVAFMAETLVFAYMGLAIFSFKHIVKPALVIWSIVLILIGRAANIYPLSFIANYFREHKITPQMQLVMWFSGLRGAIAVALSLHLEFDDESRHVLVTTTLIIVLFTVLVLGGSTAPLVKCMNSKKRRKFKRRKDVTLSKTKEMGDAVDSEQLSEYTESDVMMQGDAVDSEQLSEYTDSEGDVMVQVPSMKGFMKLDTLYLRPFFTRRITQKEAREGKRSIHRIAATWYNEVRTVAPESGSEDEEEEVEFDVTSANGALLPAQTSGASGSSGERGRLDIDTSAL